MVDLEKVRYPSITPYRKRIQVGVGARLRLTDTSLAAPRALAHNLLRRTDYKIRNGPKGLQYGEGYILDYWVL